MSVNYESKSDEEIYGLGLQYTEWNFKGKHVPIICSEGGVGRSLETITFFANIFFTRGGGTSMTTYAPSYSYVTNKNRSITFNSTALGFYDFKQSNNVRAAFWHEKTVY